MGFLKKIFKKKKGGTKLGNLIRGVAKKITGGKAGTGKNMIPADQPTEAEQPTNIMEQIGSAVGTLANDNLAPLVKNALTGTKDYVQGTSILDTATDAVTGSFMDSLMEHLKKRWYLILIPFGLIILAIWYFAKRKTTPRRRF